MVWIVGFGVLLASCDEHALTPTAPGGRGGEQPTPRFAVVRGEPMQVESLVQLAGDAIRVRAINGSGVAVGNLDPDYDHPVVWRNGTPVRLPMPAAGSEAYPTALNEAGQIVGWGSIVTASGRTSRALLWSDGQVTVLESPAGMIHSEAVDINASGEIVGMAWSESILEMRAVVWRDGVPTLLPSAPGETVSAASFINDDGIVLGGSVYHARPPLTAWQNDELVWFDEEERISGSWVGITDDGRGYATGDSIYVWEAGETEAIGAGGDQILVYDMSSAGQMVGRLGGVYGVWTSADVFRPWDGQFDRCERIAANRYVACVRVTDWFIARLRVDDGGPSGAERVSDLRSTAASGTTVTLTWTQVDDGTGSPASYRVKYATPPIDWRTATIGCTRTLPGTAIGQPMSCTVEGLAEGTDYEFQLMSFRTVDGVWVDARSSNVTAASTSGSGIGRVDDLSVTDVTESSITVHWTQIDDGTGNPARYRVKYAEPPISYPTATRSCTIRGEEIGAELSCTITGLDSGTTYDVQLKSYRLEDGLWVDAVVSNVTSATTTQ
jgi:uncharacterized membrane protein